MGSLKLEAKARADLAFVTTALKRDRKLKVRVLGCTVHTEAGPVALQRSKAVVAHLNTHGVLRQQCRAEACPPAMIHGLQEHGMSAVRFTVVQSLLFAKRLAFESGTAAVPSKAEPMLLKVARMLQDNPELELMLEGHADAREDHPIELSRARAVAIRKWLVAQGVTCALGVLPCGAAYPVASNLTAQGRRHNRRAEVQIRLRGAT